LEPGDRILNSKGELKALLATSVETLQQPEKIYNFTVEDYHTYYVGTNSVLVHNIGCSKFVTSIIRKIRAIGDDILDIMESAGGHTLQKHVSQTNEELIRRAIQEEVEAATSFTNKSTAIKAVQQNLRRNCKEIAQWLESGIDLKRHLMLTIYTL
jgi:phage-related protein